MSSGEVTAVRTVHFPNNLTHFDILMPVYTEEFPGELPVFSSVMYPLTFIFHPSSSFASPFVTLS
jgi:hypothetical protein